MTASSRATLRQMLTLPYIVLVLVAAATIGFLSYNAGKDAVDTLSGQLLTETVNRIAQAVDQHISGSEAVLETAFPSDMPVPASVEDDLEALALSPNGFAFIVEPDGNLVATSRGPHLRKGVGSDNTRLNATVSEDPWATGYGSRTSPSTGLTKSANWQGRSRRCRTAFSPTASPAFRIEKRSCGASRSA